MKGLQSSYKAHNIKQLIKLKYLQLLPVLVLALVIPVAPTVSAAKYDAQINQLKQQNATAQSQQQNLATTASSITEQIAALQAQIAMLEGQISTNQAKDAKLNADIAANEAELAQQRHLLATNIKQMYVDDQMTTLEMMATSKNLGDFVDREQYRNNVQNKITDTMKRIDDLQKQLTAQKTQVRQVLADQQAMQVNLAAQKAESARLLSLNQDQQASLTQNMQANNSRISALQKLQAAENAKYNVRPVVKGGTGSYPWANVPFPNELSDPWGMYKRQCVSYTAWKVANSGRYMPYWGGRGDAKQWDDNARAAHIPVDTSPRVGDVAISNGGTYGHAMYVEAVNGDGTITVSQYNASWDGAYSVARRSVTNLVFIHF
jgi:surface antigen